MYQIDNSTSVPSLPAPAAPGPNPNGYFTGGNPGTLAATIVDADWLNAVQQELIAILQAAGVAPSKSVHTQVLSALEALFTTTTYVNTSVAAETSRAEGVEGSLSNAINAEITNRTNAVSAETSRAESAEGSLSNAINAEITNRTNAVSAETSRAESAEGSLSNAINAEITNRTNAVAAETSRAEGAENSLYSQIVAETSRAEGVENTKAPINSPNFSGTPEANGSALVTISQFSFDDGTPGYVKLPCGVIFQWGTGDIETGSIPNDVSYLISFPNASIAIVGSFLSDIPPEEGALGLSLVNNGGYQVTNTAPAGGGDGYFFLAVGF